MAERKNDPAKRVLYNRLSRVVYNLHDRCNNKNHKEWKNYGGRGVTFDPKWQSVSGFIDDVDKIDGWNEEEFLNHKLQLDKDMKVEGNKLYSKETCMWVSPQENMLIQPSRQTPFWAFNQYTFELLSGVSPTLFANQHGLSQSVTLAVLSGTKHRSGNWYMWRKDHTAPKVTYVFAKKDGQVLWDINGQRLSEKLGASRTTVTGLFNKARRFGTPLDYHGWTISKEIVDLGDIIKRLTTKLPDSPMNG